MVTFARASKTHNAMVTSTCMDTGGVRFHAGDGALLVTPHASSVAQSAAAALHIMLSRKRVSLYVETMLLVRRDVQNVLRRTEELLKREAWSADECVHAALERLSSRATQRGSAFWQLLTSAQTGSPKDSVVRLDKPCIMLPGDLRTLAMPSSWDDVCAFFRVHRQRILTGDDRTDARVDPMMVPLWALYVMPGRKEQAIGLKGEQVRRMCSTPQPEAELITLLSLSAALLRFVFMDRVGPQDRTRARLTAVRWVSNTTDRVVLVPTCETRSVPSTARNLVDMSAVVKERVVTAPSTSGPLLASIVDHATRPRAQDDAMLARVRLCLRRVYLQHIEVKAEERKRQRKKWQRNAVRRAAERRAAGCDEEAGLAGAAAQEAAEAEADAAFDGGLADEAPAGPQSTPRAAGSGPPSDPCTPPDRGSSFSAATQPLILNEPPGGMREPSHPQAEHQASAAESERVLERREPPPPPPRAEQQRST